ncbi:MAG: hypothetical protein NDJ89_00915 [Oligoflexia bacterium]|nr:hypothetical protein [Oligoflexia bacterium]
MKKFTTFFLAMLALVSLSAASAFAVPGGEAKTSKTVTGQKDDNLPCPADNARESKDLPSTGTKSSGSETSGSKTHQGN